MTPILSIDDLTVEFKTRRGQVRAVNNVSIDLCEGERLGLVGESGSGKSMMLLTMLRLTPAPGKVTSGKILYEGKYLDGLSKREMQALRGKELSMIFQDPMTTLNPVFRIGDQIRESLKVHNIFPSNGWGGRRRKNDAERKKVVELMAEVGIPSPEERYENYPFEFSGGMQQRAMIAIALSCSPRILLADEPTTALDVTVQAQIMNLLDRINQERKTTTILVTHDLSLAAEFCDRIAVMYAGNIVEQGDVRKLIHTPRHPYTRGLLNSLPRLRYGKQPFTPIPGEVDLASLPQGCAFAPRCAESLERCFHEKPKPVRVGADHIVKCLRIREIS